MKKERESGILVLALLRQEMDFRRVRATLSLDDRGNHVPQKISESTRTKHDI